MRKIQRDMHMVTKNNVYKLIKNIKTLVNSNEFKNKHCEKRLLRGTENYLSNTLYILFLDCQESLYLQN